MANIQILGDPFCTNLSHVQTNKNSMIDIFIWNRQKPKSKHLWTTFRIVSSQFFLIEWPATSNSSLQLLFYLHPEKHRYMIPLFSFSYIYSNTWFKKSESDWNRAKVERDALTLARFWSLFRKFEFQFVDIFLIFKSTLIILLRRSNHIFTGSDICFSSVRRSDKIMLT